MGELNNLHYIQTMDYRVSTKSCAEEHQINVKVLIYCKNMLHNII